MECTLHRHRPSNAFFASARSSTCSRLPLQVLRPTVPQLWRLLLVALQVLLPVARYWRFKLENLKSAALCPIRTQQLPLPPATAPQRAASPSIRSSTAAVAVQWRLRLQLHCRP
jgi:hypothetical protein